MNETTLTHLGVSLSERPQESVPEVWALVIAWCVEEPQRVGEVFLLMHAEAARPYVLGRGPSQPDDPGPRLRPARQRPGRIDPTAPLSSRLISRVQLRIAVEDEGLQVENVGRAPMLHNDRETTRAQLTAGDSLQVGNQLLLLCMRRPSYLVGEPVLDNQHPFGEADRDGVVGESPAVWQLRRRITFVAPRPGHVLVAGGSGTGKELVANAVHAHSPRADKALVARNAATIPEGLVDAELFGNAKNFPNPGMADRPGLIGQADGSTLFLDEFAELPTAMQAHLLRVLDGGEYQRLGESTPRRSNFRLVAATNRPESALKHDILARLTFRVQTPDLNARREDIPLIVRHQMRRLAKHDPDVAREFFGGDPSREPKLPCALMRALLQHNYTTNVRELSNLLWEVLAKHIDGSQRLNEEMAFDFLSSRERPVLGMTASATDASQSTTRPLTDSWPPARDSSPPALGRTSSLPPPSSASGKGPSPEEIQACLDRHNGSIEQAWPELGLSSRYALARLIKKHGLEIRKRKFR